MSLSADLSESSRTRQDEVYRRRKVQDSSSRRRRTVQRRTNSSRKYQVANILISRLKMRVFSRLTMKERSDEHYNRYIRRNLSSRTTILLRRATTKLIETNNRIKLRQLANQSELTLFLVAVN